ncbi:MAG: transposase [Ruminococcus flavefaciens]|nr:transposase [Ruminococcus flavefaciens]
MKIISQISLFGDTQNENLGVLERLQGVIEYMPDEKLIWRLEEIRGKGRDDWPVGAMWNSLLASFIFDHDSIASLIRELNRNSQLRAVCGFQPHFHTGKDGVPKLMIVPGASAYTNFINNLRGCREELRKMFDSLVAYMYENIEDFGDILMVDGKAVQSFAAKPSRKASGHKGEHDADWCKNIHNDHAAGRSEHKDSKVVRFQAPPDSGYGL